MTIRSKILAVTSLLLIVFAVTTLVSALFIRRVIAELEGITDYHLQLVDVVAEVDVETFEYELNLFRLLQTSGVAADEAAAVATRQREIAEQLRQSFARGFAMLGAAVDDERNDFTDRIELARIEGKFRTLDRHVAPFTALGAAVMDAVTAGRGTEASRLAGGFRA